MDEPELSDYMQMLKRHWIVALVIFMAVLGGVAAYTFTAPKTYQARSLVMVTNQDQTSFLLGSQLARTDIQTQTEIIMSSSVLSKVTQSQPYELTARAIKNSNVIEIIVESPDPDAAMTTANRVARAYVDYTRDSKIEDALQVSSFISAQLESYKLELDQLNSEIAEHEARRAGLALELAEFDNLISSYKRDLETCQLNQSSDCESELRRYTILVAQRQEAAAFEDEARYQSLLQTKQAKEKIYDYLLSRREEVNIVAKEGTGFIKIIEFAGLPMQPAKPNTVLNMAIGVLLAFVASFGTVFLISQNRARPAEVEAELAPVIAAMPKLGRRRIERHPEAKEEIRKLRYALIKSGSSTISITSPGKKQGKSMILSSVAASIAQSGKKVVVVDANLRAPVMDSLLQVRDKGPGLAEMLAKPDQALRVRKTTTDNLYLLPAGKVGSLSLDQLSAEKIRQLSKKLSGEFEMVLYDCPALKAAESALIAAETDGVLVVVPEKARRKDVLQAKADLQKANIIGTVLNRK